MMSPEQEAHLKEVLAVSHLLINDKYRHGQKAHGGNLFDLSASQLIDEAINEAVDQLVYLLTAKERINEVKDYGKNTVC